MGLSKPLVLERLDSTPVAVAELRTMLRGVDALFVSPLSSIVDVDEYAGKLLAHGCVIVAGVGQERVGMVAGYLNDPGGVAYVSILVVMEAFRGEGIGERLVDAFVEQSRMAGMHTVKVRTGVGNAARRLYGRYGFEEVGIDELGNVALQFPVRPR